MANKTGYAELALACDDVLTVLNRRINGRPVDQFSQPVREAIENVTA